MKKLLIFIIFILILGVLGWFIISNKTGLQGNEDNAQKESGGFFSNLFPFTGSASDEERPVTDIQNTDNTMRKGPLLQGNANGNRLQQLTNVAIAGYISSTTEQGRVVRYVERATGNVFEINEKGEEKRITNTTIPGIYEAVWSQDLEHVVLRYVNENDVIKTYMGTIAPSDEATSSENIDMITGTFLPDDISYLIPNKDSTEVLYLEPFQTGVRGVISDFEGGTRPVFTSLFSEWLVEWPNSGTITATTKAGYGIPGFTYIVENGSFLKLLGGIPGLTTLVSPDAKDILYSESTENGLTAHLWNNTNSQTTALSLKTLPEKCAWDTNTESGQIVYCGVPSTIPPSEYPTSWYQGIVSFDDDVWKIDADQNTVQIIASPKTLVGTGVDIIDPALSSDGHVLYFINKKDATLWSLEFTTTEASEEDS